MRPTWRLSLFGTVGLHSDQESYTAFETKRAAKLLVLLGLSRTGKMRRDDVADLLWPEDFIDSTRLRLRQELSRLRRGLGGNDDLIETTIDFISLDRSLVENDLERLSGPRSLSTEELIGLLTEPFLPGWDDAWVTAKRDEVDQLRIRAAIGIASELIDSDEPDKALQVLQACTPISPLNEEIRDLTMKAHNARGSLSDALGEYRRHKKAESPPESETQSIQSSTELPTFDAFELPQPPHPIDQFFGRKEVSQEIKKFVQNHSDQRLVSLIGTGGIGKTRLAIEAMRGVERKAGFVSFVECQTDSSPEFHLLQALVPGKNVPDPITLIKRLLQGKTCVLVLDNLEHLHDPGKFVSSLLSAVSDLRLIVTSRKPMKVAGEHVIKIPPLERGQEAAPMLTELTGSKRPDSRRSALYEEIAELCGGIPLTLRLAAARLRLLEPEELVEELKQSTTLLRAALPDLEERHRDLNRMLRLAVSSLSAEDATTILNISYFPAGVTRAIVRRMVGTQVDEVLERLLDSALIWLDDDVSPLRFRILEPIRQFLEEESSEDQRLKARQNFVDQVVEISKQLLPCWNVASDTQDAVYLKDRENHRRALRLAFDIDLEKAVCLFQKTWTYELPMGQISEIDEIADRLETTQEKYDSAMGHIFICRAWCRSSEGKLDEAAILARKSKEHFDRVQDVADSCHALATAYEHERYKLTWEEVKRNYAEVIALAAVHAPSFLPVLKVWRGSISSIRREWESAAEDLESGYQISKELGSFGTQVYAGVALLTIDFETQRRDKMHERILEMRQIFESFENRHCQSVFLRAEARVALLEGEIIQAEEFARKGLLINSYTGNILHAMEIKVSLARSLIAQDRLIEAETFIQEMALAVSQQMFRIAVLAVACKAEIRWKQDHFDKARDLLADALAFRDGNKVDIHIMESVYLDELIKKMDLPSWERSISADQLSAILSQ